MRVGILGGAFNPPHLGHLVCAQEALVQLELDRVVFVPVGEAPHRTLDDDPGPEARLVLPSDFQLARRPYRLLLALTHDANEVFFNDYFYHTGNCFERCFVDIRELGADAGRMDHSAVQHSR